MFLFKSSRFGRRVTSALLVLCIAFVAMSFSGCKPPTDTGSVPEVSSLDLLKGTWNGSFTGESYTITETTFDSAGSYAGDNLTVSEVDEKSGYIYIKFTRAANADWTYSETAPDVGKWYCVAYKNLSENSVSLSGAYNAAGKSACDTLDEAKKEFTIENGYFSGYSECVKKQAE